jgi:hypothetical protein
MHIEKNGRKGRQTTKEKQKEIEKKRKRKGKKTDGFEP